MWFSFFCSGVSGGVSEEIRSAMRPSSVCMPVAVTTAVPLPPTTIVPANTILVLSASEGVLSDNDFTFFSTG
ncbi:unknown [Roseburia sp. CAG:309]|nr:unknown [Roseburia sp. CAG:309]